MARAYTTRVGRPRRRTARTYHELLALPSREQPDDGLVLGPWVTTAESGWDWNEGPCACGGILRWAEAGYGPWHRICDRCGSHWELNLITLVPHDDLSEIAPRPRGVLPVIAGDPCQPCGIIQRGGQPCQVVPPDVLPFYEAARALVRPEHITDEVLDHGVLYGGWASRARFYRG
jgi:hypothetical protein